MVSEIWLCLGYAVVAPAKSYGQAGPLLFAPRTEQTALAPWERLSQFTMCVASVRQLVQALIKIAELKIEDKARAPGAGDTDHHLIPFRPLGSGQDRIAMDDRAFEDPCLA